MALEDRVKELEDEIKVLKNEIQTILLDIQEQILSHYYPSLYPSANKEVTLAKSNGLNQAAELVPQPVSQIIAQPMPMSVASHGLHNKYKMQTIALVEEPEEGNKDEHEHDDEDVPPVRLATFPKSDHGKQKARAAVNNRTPASPPHKPELEAKTQTLTAEDEAFLDAIIAAKGEASKKETAVSFKEFNDLFKQKSPDGSLDSDLFTEELLDNLLRDSLSILSDENSNDLSNLFSSPFSKREEASDTNSINSQAVKLTVRELINWVDESVAVIGKDPTKQAIAMYVRAGDLSNEMRDALLHLVESSHADPATEKAGIRQIIDTLGQLNDILDHHTPDYLNQVMRFIVEVNFG